MKKYFFLSILFIAACSVASAQTKFITKGKIEFEKRVNTHKTIDALSEGDEDRSWMDNLKKLVPQFDITYFDLYFDGNKTLYKPGREVVKDVNTPDWFKGPANDNTVYTDLSAGQSTSQKNVYESTFLIQDSVRKVNWRLTSDIRTIAGFECHKAVGIIMDSVYVIAFYTDQVITPGGPESFNGLPGMILGIAIPRINATWFATKLELDEVTDKDLAAPKKGKKVTNKEVMTQIQSSLKDWGKYGQRNIWYIMI